MRCLRLREGGAVGLVQHGAGQRGGGDRRVVLQRPRWRRRRLVVKVCGVVTESFTVTAIGKLPLAVGVPEITPVFAARLRPAGRFPEVMDQE